MTGYHDIRSVTERFCPQAGKNIVLEVSVGQDGERIENCMLRGECEFRRDAVCVSGHGADGKKA